MNPSRTWRNKGNDGETRGQPHFSRPQAISNSAHAFVVVLVRSTASLSSDKAGMSQDHSIYQHSVRIDVTTCNSSAHNSPPHTNKHISETSVTIPDVVYVIDTGKMREVRRNKRTSSSMLVAAWCSKSSAKQRRGRAGRVQPGV